MTTPSDDSLAPPPDVAAATEAAPVHPKTVCANCGSERSGPHCYACGQPVKGMVRQLSSILADIGDTVLFFVLCFFCLFGLLLFLFGFLLFVFLSGRRVRYVTPVRLFFFLSVVAFLLLQISLDATLDLQNAIRFDNGVCGVVSALSVVVLQTRREAALAQLEQAKLAPNLSPRAMRGIDKAEEQIRMQADKRARYLAQLAAAKANGTPPPPEPRIDSDRDDFNVELGGKDWDPRVTPIQIGWLPAFVNAKLTVLARHGVENLPRIKKDPKPFLLGAFGLLPQVLFVLMPLFALLLKVFYLFKRRLYMEHLIVALHSHSFIYFALLLLTVLGLLRSWANGAAPWMSGLLSVAIFVLGWWLPIYLLIMQKRVYRQGWFFTIVKYLLIGLCYTILVGCGVAVAFVVSLATTN